MREFTLLILLLTFVIQPGIAQEMLVPLVDMPLKRKDMERRVERMKTDSRASYRGGTMELPFVDDFSTDKFIGNEDGEAIHWLDHQVFRNYTFGKNPPSLGVATFDGGDEFGYPYDFGANNTGVPCDTLTSMPINLDYDASENVWLSFFYQGGGFGETPNPNDGDSLTLHFYAPNLDQWFHAWSVAGSAMDDFQQVFIPITQSRYLRDGFQFRFVNYATPRGSLDHFHIDYVQLDRNREENEVIDDVSFVYPIRSLLESYSSMPWTHYVQNPTSFMANEIETLVFSNNQPPPPPQTGNRTIFDRTLEISRQGALQSTFVNPSEPPIAPQSFLTLTEPINADPFNYVFDTAVDEVAAVFDVTISNNVSPDLIPTNNTIRMRQEFYSNYGYDDGTAEGGYSATPTGSRIAMRYVNMKADSLVGIMVWFVTADKHPAGGASSFFPTIWADGGSQPGIEIAQGLWEAVEIEPDTTYGWRYFEFLEPVFLSEGAFYAGILQSTDDRIFIGLDKNSNFNPGNLYYYNPNWGIWSSSSFEGSLMLRPVFQSSNIGPVTVRDEALSSARIFPNPVKDQLFIETGQPHFRGTAEVLDLTGKVMKRSDIHVNAQWDLGDLVPGMYLLRLASNDGSTSRVFKFVKL